MEHKLIPPGKVLAGFAGANSPGSYLDAIATKLDGLAEVLGFQQAQTDMPDVITVKHTTLQEDRRKIDQAYAGHDWHDGDMMIYGQARMLATVDTHTTTSDWVNPDSLLEWALGIQEALAVVVVPNTPTIEPTATEPAGTEHPKESV